MAFCGADQVTDANFWVSTCRRYAAVLMLLVRRRSLVAVVEKEQESLFKSGMDDRTEISFRKKSRQ